MVINVGRFAAFVSFITKRSNCNFDSTDCDDMLSLIQSINAEVPAMPIKVDPQQVDDLMVQMFAGTSKIEAIKAYRTLTGLGLKESKDAVEKYWKQKPFGVD